MSAPMTLAKRPRPMMAALVVASWVMVACNSAELDQRKSPTETRLRVQVINDHNLDVVIYLVTTGTPVRLGSVPAFGRGTLYVGRAFVTAGHVQLALDPIGTADRHVLNPIMVGPGQVLQLTIENYLPFSSGVPYSPEDAPLP